MSRAERLNTIVKQLQAESPDIEAAALISEDSLIIASALPQDVDDLRVAGMCATLLNLGTRAARELERGKLEQVLIRGKEGYVVMMTATEGTMLITMTTAAAKLGLVFLDMSHAISDLHKVL